MLYSSLLVRISMSFEKTDITGCMEDKCNDIRLMINFKRGDVRKMPPPKGRVQRRSTLSDLE